MSNIQSFKRGLEQALSRKLKLQQSNVNAVPANAAPENAEPTTPIATKNPTEEQYRTTLLSKAREHYRQQQVDDNQSSQTTI